MKFGGLVWCFIVTSFQHFTFYTSFNTASKPHSTSNKTTPLNKGHFSILRSNLVNAETFKNYFYAAHKTTNLRGFIKNHDPEQSLSTIHHRILLIEESKEDEEGRDEDSLSFHWRIPPPVTIQPDITMSHRYLRSTVVPLLVDNFNDDDGTIKSKKRTSFTTAHFVTKISVMNILFTVCDILFIW
jgi:hypothetical protein